jgi:hypothetical protein
MLFLQNLFLHKEGDFLGGFFNWIWCTIISLASCFKNQWMKNCPLLLLEAVKCHLQATEWLLWCLKVNLRLQPLKCICKIQILKQIITLVFVSFPTTSMN